MISCDVPLFVILCVHLLGPGPAWTGESYVRHKDFFRPSSVTLRGPLKDSAMGWTEELWLNYSWDLDLH